jgi:hypothetical protein
MTNTINTNTPIIFSDCSLGLFSRLVLSMYQDGDLAFVFQLQHERIDAVATNPAARPSKGGGTTKEEQA